MLKEDSELKLLKTWFYLVCFTLFSDVTFLLPESEHWVGREFFICEVLHLLHQFVPDLYSVTLFLPTSSNTAYSLSGIGRFDKILPCPNEDEQEQRLSLASIKFLMWNIYEIIHIWNAGEDESEEWSSQ